MTTALLRPATINDADLLLKWVNDKSSLQWKQHTNNLIEPKDHRNWLSSRLSDPTCRIWIISDAQERAVGQIRLELDGKDVMVDIFVAPDNRGKGVASAALSAAMTKYHDACGVDKFCAIIHKNNKASLRLFESVGFSADQHSQEPWLTLRSSGKKQEL